MAKKYARLFQTCIDRSHRIGGVSPGETAPKVAAGITGDDGIEDTPPAISAVDLPVSQDGAFQHPKLVE